MSAKLLHYMKLKPYFTDLLKNS